MKYNYIWFEDKHSRIFRITICYENGKYSFAIQNPNDMFVKKVGREKALENFNSSYYFYGCNDRWIGVKKTFLAVFFHNTTTRYKVLPRFCHKAVLLIKPKLKVVEC